MASRPPNDDLLGAFITGPDLLLSGKPAIFRIDAANGAFLLVRPLLLAPSEPGTLLHHESTRLDFVSPSLIYGTLKPSDLIRLNSFYTSQQCPAPSTWQSPVDPSASPT